MAHPYLKFLIMLVIVIGIGVLVGASKSTTKPLPHSTVMVKILKGHGSGVHIGDGYILTAAHVVGVNKKGITIKDEFNQVRTAELLWSNTVYDVALLKLPKKVKIKSSKLICTNPRIGDAIKVIGNPLGLRDITNMGLISGKVQKFGHWKEVIFANVSVLFGMSGGPVFNTSDQVIGLMVGFQDAPMGFTASWTDFTTVVPAKTLCRLLAR